MAVQKRSEITRNRIIETASALFLEKGYTATTVRDICLRSGISLSRVNYHFSSKAALAGEICRELMQNFYAQMKTTSRNRRNYSLVTESVALRFLTDLIIDDGRFAAGHFYRDAAGEGILSEIFTAEDHNSFEHLVQNSADVPTEQLDLRIGIYSRLFAASLSSVSDCWAELLEKTGGNRDTARRLLQDTIAGLFMQMLDVPHDAQRAMVELSEAYYRLISVDLAGLTDVRVTMQVGLSLREKVRILEQLLPNTAIRLKSTPDRTGIELDTENNISKE